MIKTFIYNKFNALVIFLSNSLSFLFSMSLEDVNRMLETFVTTLQLVIAILSLLVLINDKYLSRLFKRFKISKNESKKDL